MTVWDPFSVPIESVAEAGSSTNHGRVTTQLAEPVECVAGWAGRRRPASRAGVPNRQRHGGSSMAVETTPWRLPNLAQMSLGLSGLRGRGKGAQPDRVRIRHGVAVTVEGAPWPLVMGGKRSPTVA